MKYSFTSFSCPDLDAAQMISVARQYGYDGIEPRISAGHKHGIEIGADKILVDDIKRQLKNSSVKICCIATSCSFADPEKADGSVETAKRSIELASDLNTPVIRVFGGQIPKGMERQQSSELIADSLGGLANYAQNKGVVICLETHDDWSDAQFVSDVMKRIDHPAVAVNWDIMHPVFTGRFSVETAFQILKPWIRHVHIHDGTKKNGKLEFKPMGSGDVDHRVAVKLLKNSGYEGFLSGEWICWEPYDIHLPRELDALKNYEI